MLRSFNSIAFRQLRTRPLRSVLTAFGVVLGVGMVFGVLLLTGTIRATFDEVIDSAWGETDLIVMGEGNGTMPGRTLDDIKDVQGVRDAAGMVGGMFTRLNRDDSPVKGPKGQMLIAGYETKGYQPYDFRLVKGRRIASGREVMVEQNWAREHGYQIGDRVRVAGPTGRTELPIIGIFKLTSSLNVGGLGYAAMPLPAARRLFDQPKGWMQISIVADDRGDVGPLKKKVEHVLGSGARVQTPGEVSDQISDQLAGLNIVLYFFSGVALFVGGFLILNSFNMTVLQRMRELGMLRTLGASRRMAMSSVLIEALVLGIVGTRARARARARARVWAHLADARHGRPGRHARRQHRRGNHGRFYWHRGDPARRVLARTACRADLAHPGGARRRTGPSHCPEATTHHRPGPVPPRRLVRRLVLVRRRERNGRPGGLWGDPDDDGDVRRHGGGRAVHHPAGHPLARSACPPTPPDWRPACRRLAPLQPASHRGDRRRAHDRALGGRGQQLDVVELHRDDQRPDRQGLRARLHRPGTGLHDRAGRRAGRAALGPESHRGDARDGHGRSDEGDAA